MQHSWWSSSTREIHCLFTLWYCFPIFIFYLSCLLAPFIFPCRTVFWEAWLKDWHNHTSSISFFFLFYCSRKLFKLANCCVSLAAHITKVIPARDVLDPNVAYQHSGLHFLFQICSQGPNPSCMRIIKMTKEHITLILIGKLHSLSLVWVL